MPRVVRVQRHLATSAAASAAASAPRIPWQYGGPGHEELYEFGQREWCEAAAALGVQMGHPGKLVVDVAGEASFMMNIHARVSSFPFPVPLRSLSASPLMSTRFATSLIR